VFVAPMAQGGLLHATADLMALLHLSQFAAW
jgi:hypothetical protein